MSALGAVTTLLAPMLLDPVSYGTFALLAVLFQHASECDLGLSQLSDKELARAGTISFARLEDFVQARWLIALGLGALLLPAASLVTATTGQFNLIDSAIAICAGLAMMIANGRVVAFRTMRRIREFTVSALLLQAGLTLPRLGGLLVAGVSGCFAVLALWYAAAALMMAKPRRFTLDRINADVLLIRAGLPLFAFAGLWLVYMLVSRWISSVISDPHDFGLFAFGANLTAIAISLLSTVAQVRYPRIIVALHRSRPAGSSLIEKDLICLSWTLAVAVAIGATGARTVIELAFPAYIEAHQAAVVLGMSCIPLGIIAWVLPITVAFSSNPVSDSLRIFTPALLVLAIGMILGDGMGGIVGQAWACVCASFLLAATLLVHMRQIGVLEPKTCHVLLIIEAVLFGAIVGIVAITLS
jgi:O-antigen/teichoic acid export membrane protein